MRWTCCHLSIALLVAVGGSPAHAQLTSPQIGWEAELSTVAHNVTGTVSIFDEDTLRIDDFTYDGTGISVYFYLGTEDTSTAFSSGLQIGPQLLGTVFDGLQQPFFVDLPDSQTLEGWNAISVWCVPAGANFGSGSFVSVEEPSADFDGDGDVDGADFLMWQRGESPNPRSASDLELWEANYGLQSPPLSASVTAVPEPSSCLIMFGAVVALFRDRAIASA